MIYAGLKFSQYCKILCDDAKSIGYGGTGCAAHVEITGIQPAAKIGYNF